jgi:glucokinase
LPRSAPIYFLAELAYHLVNLTIAIDPERVVVGGGMVRSWDRLRPTLAAALATAVPFPPDLVLAAYPFDAPLIGALAMATDAVHELAEPAGLARQVRSDVRPDVQSDVRTEGAQA